MTLFSVHVCGYNESSGIEPGEKYSECLDVTVEAQDHIEAQSIALAQYPEYKGVRVQSEWNAETKDWEEY